MSNEYTVLLGNIDSGTYTCTLYPDNFTLLLSSIKFS